MTDDVATPCGGIFTSPIRRLIKRDGQEMPQPLSKCRRCGKRIALDAHGSWYHCDTSMTERCNP